MVNVPIGTMTPASWTQSHSDPAVPNRVYRMRRTRPQWKFVNHQTINWKQYHYADGSLGGIVKMPLSDTDTGNIIDAPGGVAGWEDQAACCS